MEKFVGDTWDRKDFEYQVVAKVPHGEKEGIYVYLISKRKYETDEHRYYVDEY